MVALLHNMRKYSDNTVMNFFSTNNVPLGSEEKVPVAPKTQSPALTDAQVKAALIHAMTESVQGMYQRASTGRNGGRKGKGGKTSVLKFPSVAVISRANAIYNFYKSSSFTKLVADPAIETKGAYNFALSQIQDVADLVKVFDQYRIAMVEISFMPRANAVTSFAAFDRYATCIEYTDSTAITFSQIEENPTCRVTEAYTGQVRTIIPQIAVAAYSGAFTSYMSVVAPWLDCASPNILHYGIKYVIKASTSQAEWDIRIRYHVQFRNAI